jgi:phosphatidylserine/phosphatidylglycerophosphate/cardiolipin synthase-like enzyme
VVGAHDIEAARTVFATLRKSAMTREQAAVAVRLMAEDRRDTSGERAALVWSDHDVRGSRDTAVVAHELFREARTSVVVSTFSIGHRREDGEPAGHPLLLPLAERMDALPSLHVRFYVNIRRPQWQATASEEEVVVAWARWFRAEVWPWERVPEVYFDPRTLQMGDEVACLHAKCIVVDDARALVTSANLTEAAHSRNVEAGVLLDDPALAKGLRLRFEALISRALVQQVRWT